MAVRIRLARFGRKKRAFFRIVVADSKAPRDGRNIEVLGFYDPILPKDHERRLKVDVERLKRWLRVGAQPADPIARFIKRGLIVLDEAQ